MAGIEGSSLQKIREAYNIVLSMPEDDRLLIDCLISTYVANLHSKLSEPIWMQLIAPPGANKTEVLRPLVGAPPILFVSSLTENSLISGYTCDDGSDPSLCKLLDGKILVWKDMTTLACDSPSKIAKILGDLRDLYDGFASKASGRAGLREYISKFGIIGASTPAIDVFTEQFQQLGERFLTIRSCRYPRTHNDSVTFLLKVIALAKDKELHRAKLKEIVQNELIQIHAYMSGSSFPLPSHTPRQYWVISALAHLLSQFRATPIKSGEPVDSEVATRLVQQLINIATAHAIADNRPVLDESDITLVRRIVIDTLTVSRRRLITCLYGPEGQCPPLTIKQLIRRTRSTLDIIDKTMNQYVHNHVVVEIPINNNTLNYTLNPEIKSLIDEVGLLFPGPHLPSLLRST